MQQVHGVRPTHVHNLLINCVYARLEGGWGGAVEWEWKGGEGEGEGEQFRGKEMKGRENGEEGDIR